MTKYLISFPSEAMQLSEEELARADVDAHAVIEEAKIAGVYVFGGGIDESVTPVLVGHDGSVTPDTYPGSHLNGGFTLLELPTREDAVKWARKIAVACRCSQELPPVSCAPSGDRRTKDTSNTFASPSAHFARSSRRTPPGPP